MLLHGTASTAMRADGDRRRVDQHADDGDDERPAARPLADVAPRPDGRRRRAGGAEPSGALAGARTVAGGDQLGGLRTETWRRCGPAGRRRTRR